MKSKLKQLTKDTAIYGISTIFGRFLNFLLVPLYTNIFPPAEYGIVTNVYAIIAILNIVFMYGLDSVYLKFASSDEFPDKRFVFSITAISLFISTFVFSVLILIFVNPVAMFLSLGDKYSSLIYYVLLILVLDAFSSIPFINLRLENKAVSFTFIKVTNIIINISLNIILVLILKKGIEAVFISNLVASLYSFILTSPTYRRLFIFKFNKENYIRFLKFGFPYLPSNLAGVFMQVIDRPIVEKISGLAALGIYQANYRLGIFMMLFVSMFQYAWQPFFLSNAKEKNAKEIFSKVLTYFTLFAAIILVALTLFIEDIVKIEIFGKSLIGKAYWGGLNIVPIVLTAYIFNGFTVVLSAGIYIKEKSKSLPLIMGIGAAINIAANFLLLPLLGIFGAAIATLVSYISIAIGYFVVAQKLYPIRFEYTKIFIISILTFSSLAIFYIFNGQIVQEMTGKFILFLGFISSLFIFKVMNLKNILQLIIKQR